MAIALGGVIAGYDGSFSFERIGLEFPDTVPYVALRLVRGDCLLLSVYILWLVTHYVAQWCDSYGIRQ